jgi:Zn-dependent M28 family amino/carboxypeptidase
MMIDIARQMKRLGITPRRTIRFALWNGEEQGLVGSWKYTMAHADDMDDHLIAGSVDIGSGRITGFWMNGRGEEIQPRLEAALEPVAEEHGPFVYSDDAILGTDNFDFLLHGVANLVAIHESYNYGPNYHAESDTFDKVDTEQLRKNAAIIAAAVLGLANDETASFPQDSRAEVQALIESTPLEATMRDWNIMPAWLAGERGRAED